MIVGFDVHHCGKRTGASVGAMVASTCDSQSKYFSTISKHSARDDLSENVGADFASKLLKLLYSPYYISDGKISIFFLY